MTLNVYVLKVTQELYPLENITENTVKDFIIQNKISVMNLISGSGPHKIALSTVKDDIWCHKLALAMNVILLEKFDSIPDFLASFNITEAWYINLLEGNMRPGQTLTERIIREYKVRPSYLFEESTPGFNTSKS